MIALLAIVTISLPLQGLMLVHVLTSFIIYINPLYQELEEMIAIPEGGIPGNGHRLEEMNPTFLEKYYMYNLTPSIYVPHCSEYCCERGCLRVNRYHQLKRVMSLSLVSEWYVQANIFASPRN